MFVPCKNTLVGARVRCIFLQTLVRARHHPDTCARALSEPRPAWCLIIVPVYITAICAECGLGAP
ncbi:hypothetical protein BC826DRAFT_1039696 [Russula brevipes]|nr:hypothetical protein BC826DRAFT_1039696 [Russula brevipes]